MVSLGGKGWSSFTEGPPSAILVEIITDPQLGIKPRAGRAEYLHGGGTNGLSGFDSVLTYTCFTLV